MPPASFETPSPPLPVVLDTNVVLDLFAFDDVHAPPGRGPGCGDAHGVGGDTATLAELEYVLASRHFRPGWDAAAREATLVRYRDLMRVVQAGEGMSPLGAASLPGRRRGQAGAVHGWPDRAALHPPHPSAGGGAPAGGAPGTGGVSAG